VSLCLIWQHVIKAYERTKLAIYVGELSALRPGRFE